MNTEGKKLILIKPSSPAGAGGDTPGATRVPPPSRRPPGPKQLTMKKALHTPEFQIPLAVPQTIPFPPGRTSPSQQDALQLHVAARQHRATTFFPVITTPNFLICITQVILDAGSQS